MERLPLPTLPRRAASAPPDTTLPMPGSETAVAAALKRRHVFNCLRLSGLTLAERRMGLSQVTPLPGQAMSEPWARAKVTLSRLVDGIRAGAAASRYPGWWVLLQSDGNGSGKTHLARAAAVEVCRLGKLACFVTGIGLIDELREAQDPESEFGVVQVKERYTRCPLLVIDDLGKERPTPFASEVVFDIIDRRIRASRPVVITTNLAFGIIADRYGEYHGPAIVSRIIGQCRTSGDYTCVVMDGGDARLGE